MRKWVLGIVLLSSALCVSDVSYAGYAEGNAFSSGNTNTTPAPAAYGQVVRIAGGSRCKATAAPPSYSEGDEVPLSCELDGDLRTNAAGGSVGGPVSTLTFASGVTTNTTSTPVAGVSGGKTYWAQVAGTGAVTATVEYFGCQTNATTYCVSLGTVALSGTAAVYGVPSPAVGSANYPYHYIATTNVTGTGATVSAGVNY